MRSLERVNIRTNVRTYVLTYIRMGQTLYPLHNFVVRGDNKVKLFLGVGTVYLNGQHNLQNAQDALQHKFPQEYGHNEL